MERCRIVRMRNKQCDGASKDSKRGCRRAVSRSVSTADYEIPQVYLEGAEMDVRDVGGEYDAGGRGSL